MDIDDILITDHGHGCFVLILTGERARHFVDIRSEGVHYKEVDQLMLLSIIEHHCLPIKTIDRSPVII